MHEMIQMSTINSSLFVSLFSLSLFTFRTQSAPLLCFAARGRPPLCPFSLLHYFLFRLSSFLLGICEILVSINTTLLPLGMSLKTLVLGCRDFFSFFDSDLLAALKRINRGLAIWGQKWHVFGATLAIRAIYWKDHECHGDLIFIMLVVPWFNFLSHGHFDAPPAEMKQ